MTLAPLREAADSLAKASTPEPFSTSKTSNWIARLGGLPPYIQHIAHDLIEKRGKTRSNAIEMAVGIVKNPPSNWGADARAAAAKAAAQWEALKAKAKAKGVAHAALQHSVTWSIADESALIEAALGRLVVLDHVAGVDGMIGLLGEALLEAAAAWSPTMKRCASAENEVERHEVYDGGQHVGTISRRRAYEPGKPDRFAAFAVNGHRVTDFNTGSRQDAVRALQSHLEEAPARVIAMPTAGKYLVAKPASYSGETTYTQFSSEAAARHAAGLPPSPTVPERNSKVEAVAEGLRFDLMMVSGLDIEPLRRVQEARRRDPFELLEDFHPGERRDFRGRWEGGGGPHLGLSVSSVLPTNTRIGRPKSDAQTRYEGGVVRGSAKLRAAHAAKPQIARADLPASVGSHASADKTAGRLLKQREITDADELAREVAAGRAVDTEHAHRAVGPSGKLGAYSKERKALHEQIFQSMLQGKGVHGGGRAEAIFTAGGPASGKSGLVKTGDSHFEKAIAKDSAVKLPSDLVQADPDIIRTMLPEYKQLIAAGRKDASNVTHEEASHLAKALAKLALGRQHHLLIDTTGDSGPGKFAGKVRQAQRAGHRVSVHYATTDIATALARSNERGKKTGRFVPEDYLKAAHANVSKRFGEVSKIPGIHLRVVNTTERPLSTIAERMPGSDKLMIRNDEQFRKFLAKGR